jgi:hypothetical protein
MILATSTSEERKQWIDRITFFHRNREEVVKRYLETKRPAVHVPAGQCFGHVELDRITQNTCLTAVFHSSAAVCSEQPTTLLVLCRAHYLQIIKNIEPVGLLQCLILVQQCELFRAWNRSSLLDVARALALIYAPIQQALCLAGGNTYGVYIGYHGKVRWLEGAQSCLTDDAGEATHRFDAPAASGDRASRPGPGPDRPGPGRALAYAEFVGLREALHRSPASGTLLAQPGAYLFLLPAADLHRMWLQQNDAVQGTYQLRGRHVSPAPTTTSDWPAGERETRGEAAGLLQPQAFVQSEVLSARSRPVGRPTPTVASRAGPGGLAVPTIGVLLQRILPTRPQWQHSVGGDRGGCDRGEENPAQRRASPASGTGWDRRGLGGPGCIDTEGSEDAAGPGPGDSDAPGQLDLVRRQLGRSPRACTPGDARLVAAAQQRGLAALARPRPPPRWAPVPKPPALDLTEVVRRRGLIAVGPCPPLSLGRGDEELLGSMRAVLGCREAARRPGGS